ncbi:MAG: multidrug efflux SMR transporter [Pirellulales bacterium]
MGWLYLAAAIAFEVAGTTCMKLSEGFTKPMFGAAMFACYAICFTVLTIALKTIPLSIAYAVWAGVGTALIAAIGIAWFREPVTALKLASLALVIAGVIGLNLAGGH